MKDGNPSRLIVVGGTDVETLPVEGDTVVLTGAAAEAFKQRKPRKRPPMKDQLTRWHCAECTAELGYMQHQMVQVLRDPHEANGKLVAGSLWWACARCQLAIYRIREFGDKR
jgi:hypothetical protein